jgi:hypothetical protein
MSRNVMHDTLFEEEIINYDKLCWTGTDQNDIRLTNFVVDASNRATKLLVGRSGVRIPAETRKYPPTLGSTQLPIQWVPGSCTVGKAAGGDVNHSPPTIPRLGMNGAITTHPLYAFIAWTGTNFHSVAPEF